MPELKDALDIGKHPADRAFVHGPHLGYLCSRVMTLECELSRRPGFHQSA